MCSLVSDNIIAIAYKKIPFKLNTDKEHMKKETFIFQSFNNKDSLVKPLYESGFYLSL